MIWLDSIVWVGLGKAQWYGRTATMTRKKIAFGWYGGKYSHLEWLLGQLPEATTTVSPLVGQRRFC